MKNLLYLAAIAATAVGFTSCSSDEDLSNAAKDSGVPFKVTASAPTRATDLTSSNFKNFQLYAFEENTEWISGAQFTKNTSLWAPANAKETYNWPHADVPSNFYAVSENGASMSTAFVDDIANSQSFTYTVPTTVADQKDLLVASTIGGKSTDASVNLTFKHALAAATISLILSPKYSQTYGHSDESGAYRFILKIKSVSICNVKIKGKYNYLTSAWSDQSTYGTYTYSFTTPLIINMKWNDTPAPIKIDIDGNDGKLMFIPQTITTWDIKPNTSSTTEAAITDVPTDKSYAKIDAIGMVYVPEDVVTALDDAISSNYIGLTKKADGYYNVNTKVATLDGIVVDYSYAYWDDAANGAHPVTELYNTLAPNNFTDLTTENYAPIYKSFKLNNPNNELLKNYTHNITIELGNGVRTDHASVFGIGSDVTGGAKMR